MARSSRSDGDVVIVAEFPRNAAGKTEASPRPTVDSNATESSTIIDTAKSALQDIAVRFKDVTKTTQNVELISAELKKAGIGS